MKKNLIISSLLVALSISFIACDKKSNVTESSKVENSNKSGLNLVSGKANILFVTSEHCGSCAELKETMKHSKISAILEKDFNVIYMDVNNLQNLPAGLEAPYGTPTLYFVDASGSQLTEPMIGSKAESEFESILTNAADTYRAKYPDAK
jgi:hypothetical protein